MESFMVEKLLAEAHNGEHPGGRNTRPNGWAGLPGVEYVTSSRT